MYARERLQAIDPPNPEKTIRRVQNPPHSNGFVGTGQLSAYSVSETEQKVVEECNFSEELEWFLT